MSEIDIHIDSHDVDSDSDVRVDQSDTSDDLEDLDVEAPEADAVEQHHDLRAVEQPRTVLPVDVDPADATEQDRVVELDEDDYR